MMVGGEMLYLTHNRTGPEVACNELPAPDDPLDVSKESLMVNHTIPPSPANIGTPNPHPHNSMLEKMFPDHVINPGIWTALYEMHQDASAARNLFYEAVVDGIKRCHAESSWSDGTSEMVMSWVYYQYPQVSTKAIRDGINGIAFTGTIEQYRDERKRMEDSNFERVRAVNVLDLRSVPYKEYLQTEHWQIVRRDALKAAEYRCQVCNASTTLHVHHRTYERRGEELPADLIALCADCHKLFHDHGKVVKS